MNPPADPDDAGDERGFVASNLAAQTRRIAAFGDTPAVIALDEGGSEHCCSHAELAERAFALAGGLTRAGIGPGDRVALIAAGGADWITACLGVICAGATVVPLDSMLTGETLAHELHDSRCRVVLAGRPQIERVRECRLTDTLEVYELGQGDGEAAPSWTQLMSGGPTTISDPGPDDPCTLFYTSGTTGTPKGVPLSHANLTADLQGLLSKGLVGPGDRILLPLPLHHVYPFTVGMLAPLSVGATVVFPAGIGAAEIVAALRNSGVSVLIGVPRFHAAIASAIESGLDRRRGVSGIAARTAFRISSSLRRRVGWRAPARILFRGLREKVAPRLRIVASGGARLEPSVAWALEALGWEVLTGYGLTETSPIITFNAPGAARIGSAGRPIAGVSIKIAPLNGDTAGEILVRGPNVFAGYWNLPEATKHVFTEDGWFHTGDLGTLDPDGTLWVVGRKSESIVLAGGEKVMPEDVEKAYGDSPLIREIAVLEQEGDLVALVVPEIEELRKGGAERPAARIRDEIEDRSRQLPSAQHLAGLVITRESLPRTPLGKLRRHLLPDHYLRARDSTTPRSAAAPSAEDLALIEQSPGREIWQWLGRRFPDSTLDFDTSPQLDLGVDSLGWIGIGMELEQQFNIYLTEARIARIVTLRDFLREAANAVGDEPTAVSGALRPRTRVMLAFAYVLHSIDRVCMHAMFRIHVEGADRLPESGPLVIAANHSSYLDPLVIAACLPSRFVPTTYFAGWTGLMYRGAASRLFSRIVNVLPVDPDRTAIASLQRAREALTTDGILVWFPEGRRSPTGAMQSLMPGIGALLEGRPTPLIPIWIEGTFEAAPTGRMVPKPGTIGIRFGDAVSPKDLIRRGKGDTARDRIVDGLSQTLEELAKGIRDN